MPKRILCTPDLTSPESAEKHHSAFFRKAYVRRLYGEWYNSFAAEIQSVPRGRYLEIGSGGGFLKSVFPEVITSDILPFPKMDMVFNAEQIPFRNEELACIMMLNVFHHIHRPYLFLREAERTLVPGGKILMIEPANSIFSRFIYKNFHHEPFQGDRDWLENEFQGLQIEEIRYHTPFRYLITGGMATVQLLPAFTFDLITKLEQLVEPLHKHLGLFCSITISKKPGKSERGIQDNQ
jgi:SAM-dependent methyltransferase